MIISDRYRYIFIQNEITASSSIGIELCKNYSGKRILWKHARYKDFLKIATPEQKKYFVFTGIRNPLDIFVTIYCRSKYGNLTPKKDKFKAKKSILKKITGILVRLFIRKFNLSFKQFFLIFKSFQRDKSYKKMDIENADFIYKYENLQEDFSEILKKLGIKQIRPLPRLSKKTPSEPPYAKSIGHL